MHCNRFNNSRSYYIHTFNPVNRQLISYGGMIPVRHITALGFRILAGMYLLHAFNKTKRFIHRLFDFVAAARCYGCCFVFICLSL